VLDGKLFASAREQWHQSSRKSASPSGKAGDYDDVLSVGSTALQYHATETAAHSHSLSKTFHSPLCLASLSMRLACEGAFGITLRHWIDAGRLQPAAAFSRSQQAHLAKEDFAFFKRWQPSVFLWTRFNLRDLQDTTEL